MADHLAGAGRFADPEVVARDIVRALERRAPDVVYAPKIWRYVMSAVEHIPGRDFQTAVVLTTGLLGGSKKGRIAAALFSCSANES